MEGAVSYERDTSVQKHWRQGTVPLGQARIGNGAQHSKAAGRNSPPGLRKLQGYLARKKHPPPRTLQWDYT